MKNNSQNHKNGRESTDIYKNAETKDI